MLPDAPTLTVFPAAAAEGYATPDGRIEIPMSAVLATARKE